MATKTKYVAKLDGKPIGKRTSHRVYTHAIVVTVSEAGARSYAYNYQPSEYDRQMFDRALGIIEQGADHPVLRGWAKPDYVAKSQADARQDVEGGFEGYVARRKAEAIADFEARKAKGYYKPSVAAWAGRKDLAEKVARDWGSRSYVVSAVIVPAETL